MNRWLRSIGLLFFIFSAYGKAFSADCGLAKTLGYIDAQDYYNQEYSGYDNKLRKACKTEYESGVKSKSGEWLDFALNVDSVLGFSIRTIRSKSKQIVCTDASSQESSKIWLPIAADVLANKPSNSWVDNLSPQCKEAVKEVFKDATGQPSGNSSNQQSGSQVNSSGSQPQQPSPTNKPGTSVLDRYLTAPKEDCDAIPQSYNASDRQFAVSQCRLRNANRDKYAANANANANAASAQPASNTQSAQQQSNQSQQTANQNQARADQARQGKRRRHEPENEAHQCLTVDATSSGFGSFVNKCNFKIAYSFCNYKPKKDSWAEFHNCEGHAGNSDFVGPYGTSAAHVKNTETVYFFACKDPSWSLDTEYVPGQGLRGRCYTVGGN